MKTYKKPVVTVDAGMAEGIYAASGAKGTLNVVYHGVWDFSYQRREKPPNFVSERESLNEKTMM